MRILFCSTATNALGETYSIALFAHELISKGHKCFFLAPILGKRYLLTFGFKEESILVLPGSNEQNNELLKENWSLFNKFVNKVLPHFVIVADWHEFKLNGNSNNNSYSINWFHKNITLGTFDHCGFAPEGQTIALYTNGYKNEKKIIPTSELYSFVIRPCPPHNNKAKSEPDVYYWSINSEKDHFLFDKKRELKEKHTGSSNRLLLHPIGLWQERAIDRIFNRLNIKEKYYSDYFIPIVLNYLSSFNEEFTYVVISGNIKKEISKTHKNINIVWKPPLENEQFMELLKASDMMITDNLMSSNIGKAIYYNVLPIVFVNSVILGEKKKIISEFEITDYMKGKMQILRENNILFPYTSFPMGLNEILKMYVENPFSSCFFKTELYDETSTINLLHQILSGEKLWNKIYMNQEEYITRNKNLHNAEDILLKVKENI